MLAASFWGKNCVESSANEANGAAGGLVVLWKKGLLRKFYFISLQLYQHPYIFLKIPILPLFVFNQFTISLLTVQLRLSKITLFTLIPELIGKDFRYVFFQTGKLRERHLVYCITYSGRLTWRVPVQFWKKNVSEHLSYVLRLIKSHTLKVFHKDFRYVICMIRNSSLQTSDLHFLNFFDFFLNIILLYMYVNSFPNMCRYFLCFFNHSKIWYTRRGDHID